MRGLAALLAVTPVLAGCVGGGSDLSDAGLAGDDGGATRFSSTSIFPGDYAIGGPYSKVLSKGPFAALPHEVVSLPSPVDGSPLAIGIARPEAPVGSKVPIIAMISPYLATFGEDLRASGELRALPVQLIEEFVPHGYAVALIAVRGYAGSPGCIDGQGNVDAADFDAAITHLATQAWANGNVGTIGISYEGGTQWTLASTGNPHVKTIVPMSGYPNIFDVVVRNGTPSAALVARSTIFQVGVKALTRATEPASGAVPTAAEQACLAESGHLPAVAHTLATSERDPGGYFNERDHRDAVFADYKGSVLLVQGLRDDAIYPHSVFPFANRLADSGVPMKMMLGQWRHTEPDNLTLPPWYVDADTMTGERLNPTPRWDWAEILLHWFDFWLKGDTTVDLGPSVQVADSSGGWRNEEDWPPADASPSTFFLTPEGTIAPEPGSGDGSHPLVV
ncbi:MAG: CocE/NonD family hydrolase, partial [Methanobacteriota archaeon]